ncbi:hypothetical protein LIER_10098 [Lithospermum erythrorhizon]|uniref:Uncharacterized protein n=1 Tax=Lithospermum erythrorhizon TaxID=34254 RepID=A0AAV3PI53_LITER
MTSSPVCTLLKGSHNRGGDISGGSPQEIPPIYTSVTSTSAQQDSVPQRRPDSPVTVMDPETLVFVILCTAMGAYFTYRNLTFSRDHDPFANIAIPQDAAQTVAILFNDAEVDENPGDSDVISVEPWSVRPPSSSTTESP